MECFDDEADKREENQENLEGEENERNNTEVGKEESEGENVVKKRKVEEDIDDEDRKEMTKHNESGLLQHYISNYKPGLDKSLDVSELDFSIEDLDPSFHFAWDPPDLGISLYPSPSFITFFLSSFSSFFTLFFFLFANTISIFKINTYLKLSLSIEFLPLAQDSTKWKEPAPEKKKTVKETEKNEGVEDYRTQVREAVGKLHQVEKQTNEIVPKVQEIDELKYKVSPLHPLNEYSRLQKYKIVTNK